MEVKHTTILKGNLIANITMNYWYKYLFSLILNLNDYS